MAILRRRELLALGGSALVATPAISQDARNDLGRLRTAVDRFAKLPRTASCLIVASRSAGSWSVSHNPGARLFVGSAVKTFILAAFLREAEEGQLDENQQIAIDDTIRSLSSPVFLHLNGTTAARNVLEAMIAHSDNTATDAALSAVGVARVRTLIDEAGLKATQIPESTRRLFSYTAGAPDGVDLGWQGAQRIINGPLPGNPRPPLNDSETMASTAEEMVQWYRRALTGEFFRRPGALLEFKRIQAMADALPHVVPTDVAAYGKGGSIDWAGFHCLSLSGQMVANGTPVTFSFTINWTGPDDGMGAVFEGYKNAVAGTLSEAAKAVG